MKYTGLHYKLPKGFLSEKPGKRHQIKATEVHHCPLEESKESFPGHVFNFKIRNRDEDVQA